MSENKKIQLGLCCLNLTLRDSKPKTISSRTMTLTNIKKKGLVPLQKKAEMNLEDLITQIHWNEANGIKVFRLSSLLIPQISNPNLKIPGYTLDFAKEKLKEAGNLAKKYNQRITFHPGQYNVVGSPNENAFKNTVLDLQYHADVLNLMGMGKDSVMVVHGGGVYGNKIETVKRWCKRYINLPQSIKDRLVLENCEKCYSIEDCLKISEVINIPVVFDTHHFECYKILHPDEKFKEPSYYIPFILETWKKRGIKPKFHVSEQGNGKCGHHSDYIENIPHYLLEIPKKYGIEIDIMIEAKKKELAIFKLYEKYPFMNCKKIII